jgi:zinc transport system ATP-binding protein
MGCLNRKKRISWYTQDDRNAALNALQVVGMSSYADFRISSLSGGQKQRVFIARAINSNPKILLLDEPTASVDQNIKESIYDLLSHIHKDMTVILVTHDIGVVSSLVNKVGCLNQTFVTHYDNSITSQMLEDTYHCPVDLIAHGVPHRVFKHHKNEGG